MYSTTDDHGSVRPVDRDRYTLTFGADGTLNVRADCNQVSGTYRQVGRRLTLQPGAATLAACPPGSLADEFLQQLGAVVSQASTDNVLVLNLRQDSGNMLFEPQPTVSLSRSSWQVQSYNNGRGAVTTPLVDTEITATFGTDGTIAGNSGCNSYTGTYTVDGSALSVGSLATTTDQSCPDPVTQQEQAYLAALQAATQYSMTADRLTLRNDEGAIQVDFLPAPPD
jgi:heat shock protein HslJ